MENKRAQKLLELKRFLRKTISVLLLLILVLPTGQYCCYQASEEDDLHWEYGFIFSDLGILAVFLLVVASWGVYLRWDPTNRYRVLLALIPLLISLFIFVQAFFAIALLTPDFMPSYGVLPMLALFPCLCLYLIAEFFTTR